MTYVDLILWALAICGVVAMVVLMAWGGSLLWLRYVEFREKIAQKEVSRATAEADRSAIMSRIAQERTQSDKVITDLNTQLQRAKHELEAARKDTLAKRVDEAEQRVRAIEIEKAKLANELSSMKITGGDPRWAPDQLIEQLIQVMQRRGMVLEEQQHLPSVEEIADQVATRVKQEAVAAVVPAIVSELGSYLESRGQMGFGESQGLDAFGQTLAHIQARLDEVATAMSAGDDAPAAPVTDVSGAIAAVSDQVRKLREQVESEAGAVTTSIEGLVMRTVEIEGGMNRVRSEVVNLVTGGFEAVERAMGNLPKAGVSAGAPATGHAVSEVAITQAVRAAVSEAVGNLQQTIKAMKGPAEEAHPRVEAPSPDAIAAAVAARVETACRAAIEDSLEAVRLALAQELQGRAGGSVGQGMPAVPSQEAQASTVVPSAPAPSTPPPPAMAKVAGDGDAKRRPPPTRIGPSSSEVTPEPAHQGRVPTTMAETAPEDHPVPAPVRRPPSQRVEAGPTQTPTDQSVATDKGSDLIGSV